MLRKIALILIALPTVCMLMQSAFGMSAEPIAFMAAHKAIFWAAGASIFLYSILPYGWILIGGVVGIYLLIELAMGSI